MNRIRHAAAGCTPFGHQITEHLQQLGIATLLKADDAVDRRPGEHAFHHHLIPGSLIKIIERIRVMAGYCLEHWSDRRAHTFARPVMELPAGWKDRETIKIGHML